MVLSLAPMWRKAAVAAAFLCASAAYLFFATCSYLAYVHDQEFDLASAARATALEPRNATYWAHRGELELLNGSSDAAVVDFLQAVRLNRNRARLWFGLANAHLMAGHVGEASEAVANGIRRDPNTPEEQFEAANLYIAVGEPEKAFPLYREATRYDPALVTQAIRVVWHVTKDPNRTLGAAIYPSSAALRQFLEFSLEEHDSQAATVVWDHMLAAADPIPFSVAARYFDALIADRKLDVLESAWHQLLDRDKDVGARVTPGNLIANGGFERDILGGGLEWRYGRLANADVRIDTAERHAGSRSLRVSFSGGNVGDFGLAQYILVQANARYELSSFVKGDIVSANGPRLGVFDAYSKQPLALSDDLLGASDWRRLVTTFTTGANTRLVRVTVLREPATGGIAGNFWLDDLTLRRN